MKVRIVAVCSLCSHEYARWFDETALAEHMAEAHGMYFDPRRSARHVLRPAPATDPAPGSGRERTVVEDWEEVQPLTTATIPERKES